jgi:hypothetical protein
MPLIISSHNWVSALSHTYPNHPDLTKLRKNYSNTFEPAEMPNAMPLLFQQMKQAPFFQSNATLYTQVDTNISLTIQQLPPSLQARKIFEILNQY